MMEFELKTKYLGKDLTIRGDNFKEFHVAFAAIAELNTDYAYLIKKVGSKDPGRIRAILPDFHVAGGFPYYGARDFLSKKAVSFGQFNEADGKTRDVPFFPKGADGYFDPALQDGAREKPAGAPTPNEFHNDPGAAQPIQAAPAAAEPVGTQIKTPPRTEEEQKALYSDGPAIDRANGGVTAALAGAPPADMSFEPDDELPF